MITSPRAFLVTTLTLVALLGTAHAMSPKPARAEKSARVTQSLDAGWRFNRGDAPGAEQPGFADDAWRTVDVPHDWSIEGPFDAKAPTRGSGAFSPSGIAWYRKTFALPASDANRRVYVEFDGVMANSDVWINGTLLGHRPYGYMSFRYELTGHLNFGAQATNVLTVRADTSAQPASRWYTGAGIYRPVRLVVTDAVHFTPDSTFVTTPRIAADSASVRVTTTISNQDRASRDVTLQVTLVAPDGHTVATAESKPQSLAADASRDFAVDLTVAAPQLWQLESPALYRAVVRARAAAATLDDQTVPFGIRDAHFDSATGFWLNGKNFKLYGVCVHQDGGAFGAAVPAAVWEQRLNALRSLGVNAIRTAHNPPDPAFLEVCDRTGFLVMDELFDCWEVAKNPHDYHVYFDAWSKIDIRDTVRRDRNHPSVVLWSAGNEIHDTPKEERAKQILAGLVAAFHENDPTRPVTQALFRPNVSHDYTNGLADLLDVIGTNYRDTELVDAWRARPGRKIIGTEQQHNRQTWLTLRDNAAEAGQFLWTGVDYLGESRTWPVISASSGLVDRAGNVKASALERRAWWNSSPVVGITRRTGATQRAATDPGFSPLANRQVQFADWTPRVTEPHAENVEVYSNCEEVELFLNGKSLGVQKLPADASPRTWQVDYAPGTLHAVARNRGRDVARDELRTAGPAAKIQLSTDRMRLGTGWDDVVRIVATVVDANGIRVPAQTASISFAVAGAGAIAAVDNGDPTYHGPFHAAECPVYNGRAMAWIRASGAGRIEVTATAAGLGAGAIQLAATR